MHRLLRVGVVFALTACGAAAPPTAPATVAPAPAATPPGVKPNYVKCDPARPELPCTPDVEMRLPPAPEAPDRKAP